MTTHAASKLIFEFPPLVAKGYEQEAVEALQYLSSYVETGSSITDVENAGLGSKRKHTDKVLTTKMITSLVYKKIKEIADDADTTRLCINRMPTHHKGGRPTDHACDYARKQTYVDTYLVSIWKGMWKIDPEGIGVAPQTIATFHALTELAEVGFGITTYVAEPEIGHPWFVKQAGGKTFSLKSITLTMEQHLWFWKQVCSVKADVTNKQKSINKIVIKAGFGQEVLRDGSGSVKFTFTADKWQKHAPTLLRGGVGSGATGEKGRPKAIAREASK